MDDMKQKGRARGKGNQNGELNDSAKLTEAKVRDIRRRYSAGGITQQQLADEYEVQVMTVNCVILRKTWKHVN